MTPVDLVADSLGLMAELDNLRASILAGALLVTGWLQILALLLAAATFALWATLGTTWATRPTARTETLE